MHDPGTHLLPPVLQVLSDRRDDIEVYGRDFDTPDCNCFGDYIHINQLCKAHRLAIQSLMQDEGSKLYNCIRESLRCKR